MNMITLKSSYDSQDEVDVARHSVTVGELMRILSICDPDSAVVLHTELPFGDWYSNIDKMPIK